MLVVEKFPSCFGEVIVYASISTGSLVYSHRDALQSAADINGVSLVGYVHAIYDLILQNNAENILIIGCGGGTLGTMLADSNCNVTIVDINPISFEIARKYFGLNEKINCQTHDGMSYILADNREYDTIVVDAYDGGNIPDHLLSEKFLSSLRSRLTPTGLVVFNVHVEDGENDLPDKICSKLNSLNWQVRLLDIPWATKRNSIVLAGNIEKLTKPREPIINPLVPSYRVEEYLKTLVFRDWDKHI